MVMIYWFKAQPEHGVYTTFVEFGNTKVELLEPLGESGPITKFVAKHPQGAIHHVCYEVGIVLDGELMRCR